MIIDAILNGLMSVLTGIMDFIPDLPAMPAAITAPISGVLSYLGQGIHLIRTILSTPVFFAVITMGLALIFFDKLYKVALWVGRKIPMLNIK